LFELGANLAGAGQQLTQKKGYSGTFFTGVLAVVVASPCTAPLMGVALGYALVQPAAVALTVFAALGLGMAAPFAILTAVPALTRHLPKPGAWMQGMKEFLAFPLYLSAIALLWLLGQQAGNDAVAIVLAGGVLIAMAVWIWDGKLWRRAVGLGLVLAALSFQFSAQLQPQAKIADKPGLAFSDARVAELRAQGKPVFVNFTADWCVTCIANERVALSSQAFLDAMQNRNIAYLVADWTNSDPVISEVLSRYGRSGVPLYLLFPADPAAQAIVLPQLLTPGILTDAIDTLPASQ
jgi:thiol:disulfide interchange protein DsbD